MAEARTFGIIGIKGGVGKTSVVANLGTALAKECQKKVLVVDANFSTPHLGLHFGLISPEKTLQEIINNDSLDARHAVHEHKSGVHIVPGSLQPKRVDASSLKKKLAPLKKNYDYILIDSSPALNDEIYATLAAADELLVVTSPDYPTLSSTFHALKIAKSKKINVKGLIINRTRGKKFELTPQEIEKATQTKILALLPEDETALKALAATTPAVLFSPKSEVSKAYRELAILLEGKRKKK